MGGRGASFGNSNTKLKLKSKTPSRISELRTYITNIRAFEHSIRYNDYETGAAFDEKTGKTLFTQKGDSHSVRYTYDQWRMMRGRDTTHNHPSGENYWKHKRGRTFSGADIKSLVNSEARSKRAVAREGTYILKKIGGGTRDPQNFVKAYKSAQTKALGKVRKTWSKMIANQKRPHSSEQREELFNYLLGREYHKWLKRSARQYGYRYTFDTKHK